MKRGTIAAVIGMLVGLGVSGLALGLPIDPSTTASHSKAVQGAALAPDASDLVPTEPGPAETPTGLADPAGRYCQMLWTTVKSPVVNSRLGTKGASAVPERFFRAA